MGKWFVHHFFPTQSRNSLPGFGLVEIAVALVILGVMASLGIPALRQVIQHHRSLKRHGALDRVEMSLKGFVMQNDRLPCPGGTDGNEGLSGKRCLKSVGQVPFRTLGLPRQEVQDFIYGVDLGLATSERSSGGDIPIDPMIYPKDSNTVFFKKVPQKNLIVSEMEENGVKLPLTHNAIAYVLVDPKARKGLGGSLSGAAQENLDGDDTFIREAPGLTHVVRFKAKDELSAETK